jgi:hypothetical protein
MDTNRTVAQKATRRKMSMLELAEDLGNVSKACKIMGYLRQQFYEIRRNYQTSGSQGLVDKLPGPRNPQPNRASDEIEKAILEYSFQYPTHGCVRVVQQLALKNISVSSGGVRGFCIRHNLENKYQRLLRLEEHQGKKEEDKPDRRASTAS